MAEQLNLFLSENNPKNNLELLADFNPANAKTCTTATVYKKAPKRSISPGTLREICLLSTGFATLTIPFLYVAGKVYECGSLLWNAKIMEFNQCRETIFEAIAKPVNIATYLWLGSAVSVLGVGAYAAARYCLSDKSKKERFELLDREYSAMAAHLKEQYRKAKKEEKEKIVAAARKISENSKLIHASLQEIVHLSLPQSNLLVAKITQAADSLLLNEERQKPDEKKRG
jgi:hypothetical protein